MKMKTGYLLIGAIAGYAGYIFLTKKKKDTVFIGPLPENQSVYIAQPVVEPTTPWFGSAQPFIKGSLIGASAAAGVAGLGAGAIYYKNKLQGSMTRI